MEVTPTIIDTIGMSHDKWIEYRKKGIGGSDIGAILGVNPYSSALEVWYDKTRGVTKEEENIPAEVGLALEDYLRDKFVQWFKKTNNADIEVVIPTYILRHPVYDFAMANIDGHFYDPLTKENAILELKTTNEFGGHKWYGEEMPDSYYLQVQWYMGISGYKRAYVAFLVGNRKFDVKIVERNDEVITKILEYAKDFWENFVMKDIPPAPDGSASAEDTLNRMYPTESPEKVIEFPDFSDYGDMIEVYNEKQRYMKELQEEIEGIKQKIKLEMGDAETALIGDHRVTWKEQTRASYVVPENTFRAFRIWYKKKKEVK